MSVSGPIGRTPRQVAGPGVDDDPDPVGDPVAATDDPPPDRAVEPAAASPAADPSADEPVTSTEPAPGRSVFDTTPEGEEIVDPEPVAERDTVAEPEAVAPVEAVDPVPDADVPSVAPPPDPDDRVVLPDENDPADDVPAVETVPAPDPERDIDEDPVFLEDHATELAEAPVLTPDEGALDEPVATSAGGGFMGDTADLRTRWDEVQASFVDDPRQAVAQADEMVSEAVAALQARVEQRREDLAETWRDGEQASTDDLLVAFQRYRDLFDGVLST